MKQFDLNNFELYSPACLRIKTKVDGIIPFKLRKYQLRYLQHLKDAFPSGIIRSISLKPRQAGWSTLIAGINIHAMATRYNEMGIMLADKFSRTNDVHGIYSLMTNNLPIPVTPMIDRHNGDEIIFDNPSKEGRKTKPGLGSGFKSETANDPYAGRSGTRKWAHLTEYAFYAYAADIDEGIQNSVPLARGTRIFKESTANGMSGHGEEFYSQWQAASSNQSIYKPFFVAWYEIDDYQLPIPGGFILTKQEAGLILRCPEITNANLNWRRLKISEYSNSAESIFEPEERFNQDFPSNPEEAFLSTGRPVFDQEMLKNHINRLRSAQTPLMPIKITQKNLSMYPQFLKVFETPKEGMKYMIGADVAEGISTGDFSSASIVDMNLKQVAIFHGHLDPDVFGRCLVELARIYNKALLVPEINNMGHTTLEAIKQENYLNVYQREVKDEIDSAKITLKIGWRTTSANKQKMLNALIAAYRDQDIIIQDIDVLREMMSLSRESNGDVNLNGKDRIVGLCLAIMGIEQLPQKTIVYEPGKKVKHQFERMDKSREMGLLKKERL